MQTQNKIRKKILIVEDDPFIAMDLEDAFQFAGYDVLGPVAQVDKSLGILDETLPDFATLDYNLGNETSVAVAKRLDKHDIPYIFVSGQVERVVNDNGLSAAPLFSKPYNPSQLVETVARLLA